MTDNAFDERAAEWDANPRRVLLAEAVTTTMQNRLRLDQASRVLDYGAGTGLVSLALAAKAGLVAAADSSPGMLAVLQNKLEARGVTNVTPVLWTVGDDPAVLPPVNTVVGSMVLHHVADPAEAFRVFAGLLPQGGRIAFADLDAEDGSFHGEGQHAFHNGFDRASLGEACARAGFGDVAFHEVTAMEKPGADGTPRRYGVFLLTAARS